MKGYLKLLVLSKLKKNPMTGTDIMNMIEETLGKKPSSGSVYPLLKELTNYQFIFFKEDGNSKIYYINKKGENLILDLIKEKETALVTLIHVLTHAQGIFSENYENAILAIQSEKNKFDNVMYNVDIWIKMTSLLIVLGEKNKENVENRNVVRNILEDTYSKLKEVIKEE